MSDLPAEAVQAAAEAIAKGIVGLRGVGAEMDSETEHWGRVLAEHALEAAAAHFDVEVDRAVVAATDEATVAESERIEKRLMQEAQRLVGMELGAAAEVLRSMAIALEDQP